MVKRPPEFTPEQIADLTRKAIASGGPAKLHAGDCESLHGRPCDCEPIEINVRTKA